MLAVSVTLLRFLRRFFLGTVILLVWTCHGHNATYRFCCAASSRPCVRAEACFSAGFTPLVCAGLGLVGCRAGETFLEPGALAPFACLFL